MESFDTYFANAHVNTDVDGDGDGDDRSDNMDMLGTNELEETAMESLNADVENDYLKIPISHYDADECDLEWVLFAAEFCQATVSY